MENATKSWGIEGSQEQCPPKFLNGSSLEHPGLVLLFNMSNLGKRVLVKEVIKHPVVTQSVVQYIPTGDGH